MGYIKRKLARRSKFMYERMTGYSFRCLCLGREHYVYETAKLMEIRGHDPVLQKSAVE